MAKQLIRKALVAAVLLLGACATRGDDVASGAPQTEYSALGQEPAWALRIDRDRISYNGDGGRTRITVARPVSVATAVGQRYVTTRIVVDIVPGGCDDTLEGSGWNDRVVVSLGGRTLRGCGGPRLPDSRF